MTNEPTEPTVCPDWCVVKDEHDTHHSGPMRRGGETWVEAVREEDGTVSVTVDTGMPGFLDPEGVAELIADVAKASAIAWPDRVASTQERVAVLDERVAVMEARVAAAVPA